MKLSTTLAYVLMNNKAGVVKALTDDKQWDFLMWAKTNLENIQKTFDELEEVVALRAEFKDAEDARKKEIDIEISKIADSKTTEVPDFTIAKEDFTKDADANMKVLLVDIFVK